MRVRASSARAAARDMGCGELKLELREPVDDAFEVFKSMILALCACRNGELKLWSCIEVLRLDSAACARRRSAVDLVAG